MIFSAACALVLGGIFLAAFVIDGRIVKRNRERYVMSRYHDWRSR